MVETANLSLPQVMDITTVQLWHDNMSIYANNQHNLAVDAAAVEKISSAGIQLIVSLEKTLEQNGCRLRVEKASAVLAEVFRDFGLVELLHKWSKEV